MEYKILEQIGVDNENIDGAALNNCIVNGEDGIVREVLNECTVYTPTNNAIAINTGELLVHGFRVKITEAWTHTFTSTPTKSVLYQIVGRITLNSARGVAFDILCREKQNLQKTPLFSGEEGVYETEIAQFTHTSAGMITEISQTIKVIKVDFESIEKNSILSIIATFDITGNHLKTVSLQNLDGMTFIDWGDGTIDSNLTHRYATEGEYICKIYGISRIGEYAFQGQDNQKFDNLKKITLLEGITEIGASAFNRNQNLTSIDLPNGLKTIGDAAFIGCKPLQIEIPNSVVSIGDSAFGYCSTMETVIVNSATPPSLQRGEKEWSAYAFMHCGSLSEIIVPYQSVDDYKTAEGWRDYATLICSYATSKEMGDIASAVKATGDAINRLKSPHIIATFDITEVDTTITLKNLTGMTIEWGDGTTDNSLTHTYSKLGTYTCRIYGVSRLGDQAFFECNSLTSIELPNSVTGIGTSCFKLCKNLKFINIPNEVKTIYSYTFENCTSLTSIEIPDSISSIGAFAFSYCTSLKSVRFGRNSTLTAIGKYAFSNCTSLTSIEIPAGVVSFDVYSFLNCKQIQEFTFKNPEPASTVSNILTGSTIAKFFVPHESVQAYQEALASVANKITSQAYLSDLEELRTEIENLKTQILELKNQ